MKISFEGKTFRLIHNSAQGTSGSETRFYYRQTGDVVTAEFSGGSVLHGSILALQRNDFLDMRYHLVTIENELKSGKALAKISKNGGLIQLDLDWEWLAGSGVTGTSTYLEE